MKNELTLKLIKREKWDFLKKGGKLCGKFQIETYKINGFQGSDIEILSYINSKGVKLEKRMLLSKNYTDIPSKIDFKKAEKLFKLAPNGYYIYSNYRNNWVFFWIVFRIFETTFIM